MTETPKVRPPSRAMREAAHAVIRPRPRAGVVWGCLLSLMFAAAATGISLADRLLEVRVVAGEASPITVRVPAFGGFEGDVDLSGGSIVLARGEVADAARAAAANSVLTARGDYQTTAIVMFAGFLIVGLLYTANMRRSHLGKLVRTQAVTMVMLLVVAAGVKVALLLTPVSVLIVPIAGLALVATLVVDLSTGLATGVVAAGLFGALLPFDLGVIAVLGVQALATVLILGERRGNVDVVVAGAFGGLAAGLAYGAVYFLSSGVVPVSELDEPLRSAWIAAVAAGPISAVAAIFTQSLYQYLLGDITKNTLVDLEDLSNPLLEQIADNAPGTWQHSLAMANMAEIAANAIGANGRLVRTGAYYHDLGKSLQPKYFIENLTRGEPSPHDSLEPPVSCDAIFAHVTEGVRLARKHGLPERIIDFMHMHHGDGLLEYFWAKCQEQGNPDGLTEADFRYPGVKPQSKETAILAICDAVEAASRTLKTPTDKDIRNLVQRIVYGKLHLGQLDESGLTMSDLRKISNSLIATVKHASHDRIEYPWQREQREARAGKRDAPAPARRDDPASATQRIINEPRLDSLDVPRPLWRSEESAAAAEMIPAGVQRDPNESLPDIEIAPAQSRDDIPTLERKAQKPPENDAEHADEVEAEVAAAKPQLEIVESNPAAEMIDDGTDDDEPDEPTAARGLTPLPETLPEPPLQLGIDEPPLDEIVKYPSIVQRAGAELDKSRNTLRGTGEKRKPPALIVDSDPAADAVDPLDDLEQRITNPVPISENDGANDGVPEVAPKQESQAVFTSAEDPRQELFATPEERDKRAAKNTGLDDWESALNKVGPDLLAEGSEAGRKKKPSTIELMKKRDGGSPLDTDDEVPARATDDDELSPGVMVLGPPPATHPDRSFHNEPTVERTIVPGKDAINPSRVPTEEHEIEVPDDAYPSDDTEPVADPPSPDPALEEPVASAAPAIGKIEIVKRKARRKKPKPPPPPGKTD